MPLYELVVTARCSNPIASANLMRIIAKRVFLEGGNVRNVSIMGDRIMTKKLMGKDGSRHIIGRYVQILYDGNPDMHHTLRKEAQKSYETLRVSNFRVKDFVAEAVKFKKPLEEEAFFVKNKSLERAKYGEALKILQENQSNF